ncbi:hypothetical protein DFH27DRAFT_630590 [Peziza echinospora]|nr:hypothetical protein DFH27DRAFT_630590 [Peziza echinospora]
MKREPWPYAKPRPKERSGQHGTLRIGKQMHQGARVLKHDTGPTRSKEEVGGRSRRARHRQRGGNRGSKESRKTGKTKDKTKKDTNFTKTCLRVAYNNVGRGVKNAHYALEEAARIEPDIIVLGERWKKELPAAVCMAKGQDGAWILTGSMTHTISIRHIKTEHTVRGFYFHPDTPTGTFEEEGLGWRGQKAYRQRAGTPKDQQIQSYPLFRDPNREHTWSRGSKGSILDLIFHRDIDMTTMVKRIQGIDWDYWAAVKVKILTNASKRWRNKDLTALRKNFKNWNRKRHTPHRQARAKEAKLRLKKAIKDGKKQTWDPFVEECNLGTSGGFWFLLKVAGNSFGGTKGTIADLTNPDSTISSTVEQKVLSFQTTLFPETTPEDTLGPQKEWGPQGSTMSLDAIEAALDNSLKRTSNHSAPSPDGVPYKLLRMLRDKEPNGLLQRNRQWVVHVLSDGRMNRKVQRMVMIPKPGKDHSKPRGYRPITPSNTVDK